jgi:hydrogenase small subunit
MGVGEFLKLRGVDTPVVNIGGCPPHPDWVLGTIGMVLLGMKLDLDDLGRPRAFFGRLVHDNCPRRGWFDTGRFARKFGDEGCLYELGCKGPMTYSDCPTRHWNSGTNWVIGAGAPCNGCVEPRFFDKFAPLYEKVTQERMCAFRVKRTG